jgi:hypothetical protein
MTGSCIRRQSDADLSSEPREPGTSRRSSRRSPASFRLNSATSTGTASLVGTCALAFSGGPSGRSISSPCRWGGGWQGVVPPARGGSCGGSSWQHSTAPDLLRQPAETLFKLRTRPDRPSYPLWVPLAVWGSGVRVPSAPPVKPQVRRPTAHDEGPLQDRGEGPRARCVPDPHRVPPRQTHLDRARPLGPRRCSRSACPSVPVDQPRGQACPGGGVSRSDIAAAITAARSAAACW